MTTETHPIKKHEELALKLVKEAYGPLAWHIMKLIFEYESSGKKISENRIAKILNVDVHDVRKVLYQLQNSGIVFSKFWKINKKGWQINSWHFDEDGFKKYLSSLKSKRDEEDSSLKPYICPVCGKKFSEEEALEYNYMCDSCEEVLVMGSELSFESEKDKKESISYVEDLI